MKRLITTSIMMLAMAGSLVAGNINGRVTCAGKPVSGVSVSDGVDIVLTDSLGRYSLQSEKTSGMVYIITPRGYRAETIDGLRPRFWQPLYLDVAKEETHDFKLVRQRQLRYTVLFPTDIHLTGKTGRGDLQRFRDIVMPVIRKEASKAETIYSFNLGDFTHDIYWYEYDFNEADGLRYLQDLHYPTLMYTVMGNHDHDGATSGRDVDNRAAWLQHDCWGPGAYAANIGEDHWIFLDNIVYINTPGKGKKAPGITGARDYETRFTEEQMKWLEKDIAVLDDNTQIYICTHCPLLTHTSRKTYMPEKQMDRLAAMFSRFKNRIGVFSGHIHRFDFTACADYPMFMQYALPATSGIMWETRADWPLYSSDGADGGILVGEFCKGTDPQLRFETFKGGEKYYRFYDINEVGKYYKNVDGMREQMERFPDECMDYSEKSWKNQVFVNYWAEMPGDVVEIFENGKPLKVSRNKCVDPIKNLAYEIPVIEGNVQHNSVKAPTRCYHMFGAKTSSATTPVTVRIKDASGEIKFEETFNRPYNFDPSK